MGGFMTGIPGANPSGTQNTIPSVGGVATPAIGGSANPLGAPVPAGTSMPNASNPLSSLMGLSPAPAGSQTGTNAQGGNLAGINMKDMTNYFHKAGFPSGIGYLLSQFLAGGAGFSPQVAQAMLAALQPGVQRGEANILEQFGSQGMRTGSSAAIGLGDFMSQVTLDEGQILSQMYEQSVQNYMDVLLAGRKQGGSKLAGVGSLIGGIGSLVGGLSKTGIFGSSGGSNMAAMDSGTNA